MTNEAQMKELGRVLMPKKVTRQTYYYNPITRTYSSQRISNKDLQRIENKARIQAQQKEEKVTPINWDAYFEQDKKQTEQRILKGGVLTEDKRNRFQKYFSKVKQKIASVISLDQSRTGLIEGYDPLINKEIADNIKEWERQNIYGS